jgi:tRNA (cmo5U34)-methyltransferase
MPKSHTDTLFATPLDSAQDFLFDEKVAAVFPDMIKRSVPGYPTIINMIGAMAHRYAQPDSHLYDLGCSLGAGILAMAQNLKAPNTTIIGVDNSQAMLDKCQHYLDNHSESLDTKNILLRCEDIDNTELSQASVVVLNFTLQFIPREKRQSIVQRIADAMLPGGVLVLSEKVTFSDSHVDELFVSLHHEFKKANGYSELEISQKRSALENVLLPETVVAHQDRLKAAGFSTADLWFHCFNFASFLAIK